MVNGGNQSWGEHSCQRMGASSANKSGHNIMRPTLRTSFEILRQHTDLVSWPQIQGLLPSELPIESPVQQPPYQHEISASPPQRK